MSKRQMCDSTRQIKSYRFKPTLKRTGYVRGRDNMPVKISQKNLQRAELKRKDIFKNTAINRRPTSNERFRLIKICTVHQAYSSV